MSASSSSGRTPSPYKMSAPILLDHGSQQSFEQEEGVQQRVAAVAALALEPAVPKRKKQKTERLEVTPFNFILPAGYVPIIDDEITKKLALGDEMWLPIAKRLKVWVREVRRRANGRQFDKFYNHNESGKKCRSFHEVKRYVYLGFSAVDDNGDTPLSWWAVEQLDPVKEGDQSETSCIAQAEEELPLALAAPTVGKAGPAAASIDVIDIESD